MRRAMWQRVLAGLGVWLVAGMASGYVAIVNKPNE